MISNSAQLQCTVQIVFLLDKRLSVLLCQSVGKQTEAVLSAALRQKSDSCYPPFDVFGVTGLTYTSNFPSLEYEGLFFSLLPLSLSSVILSKPQLNHNSTTTRHNLSWVRHENDFAYCWSLRPNERESVVLYPM